VGYSTKNASILPQTGEKMNEALRVSTANSSIDAIAGMMTQRAFAKVDDISSREG
jgi:hypothetical protein